MAKNRPTAHKNKKHLARLEIERRQTKAITITAIAVVVIVALLIGYGILDTTVLQARKVVATVGGAEITVHDLQVRTRMRREQLIQAYISYAQFSQLYGFDLSAQMSQIEAELSDPLAVGQVMLEELIDGTLLSQEAERRGITVSEAELDEAIRGAFEFYPDGSPTPTITPTPVAYSTLSPEQIALVTLTPTPTATVEPSPTATIEAEASPTPTAAQPADATPTVTPFPEPTATPYTEEGFQQAYQENIDKLKTVNASEADYRRVVREDLLRKKLFEIVTADVKPESEQIWVRHILVETEEEANQIYDRLMKGDDFGALAIEFSTDTVSGPNGGDLGWAKYETFVPEFADAAFALEIGGISKPVQSDFGWHVIQAIGHEMRPMTTEEFDQAKQTVFDEWLADLRLQTEIVYVEGWDQYVPSDPDLDQVLQGMSGTGQ
ncbi:MAG: peptidylprolyl isomerase [Chloroflexota bacterium]